MNNPIKVIHRYNNLNKNVQYNILIFVGNLLNSSVIKILNKIKNKNFFETLTELNSNEINELLKTYGEYWYKNFFIYKHITYMIEKVINTNENYQQEIINKYSLEWYNKHIKKKINTKTLYNYQHIYNINKKQKLKNLKNNIFSKIIEENNYKISGGNNSINEDENENDEELYEENDIEINNNDNSENIIDLDSLNNEINNDIINYESIDKINNSINELIKITNNNNTNGKIKWNIDKDNLLYDEFISNIFVKEYIFADYIYIDDTIKTIKNKICCYYEKSKNFDTTLCFIPSRIYLWSEYEYVMQNKEIHEDKISLDNKWLINNEILNYDIEPNNNISYYEILKGNLKRLNDLLNKYENKIEFENNQNSILYDYMDYITNNEIYMIDIYNELGKNYKVDSSSLLNLYNTYVRIYFYNISLDELKNIINYLNDGELYNIEVEKIIYNYKIIYLDLLLENEIINIVNSAKNIPELYNNLFKENYITQSIIYINSKFDNILNSNTIDLYRIFDNYIVSKNYPFIKFQTLEGKIIFKYYSDDNIEKNKDIINSKWFENATYGINLKIIKNDKYFTISINSNGRIEYKIQWKEENKKSINDLYDTYVYVEDLLKKINNENNKITFEIPKNEDFKFAFINSIQQFTLPDNFIISHNDLSDFARYFFPYVSVVIDPKKRESKISNKNKSKYGTYLRFKKISNYENNTVIEKRILYFLKNYELNIKLLSLQISKEFNIVESKALTKINEVIKNYKNIKKSRDVLKKYDNIPKYKPPGIGIDIQGKTRDKYKFRISGARNKFQLYEIIYFVKAFLYIYIETYLYKKQERQTLKNKLNFLINVAKRRNKVEDIINIEYKQTIKEITKLDKNRLSYKPEKGQNQWTRNCQNSGKKIRRPQIITENNINEILTNDYVFNEKTNNYEKTIKLKGKNIILTAAKINNDAEESLFFTCDPKVNGEYMYVGFLSKSINPYGLCMPCCFKKNQELSDNVEKKNYYLKCLGKITLNISTKNTSNKLYILQNANKIYENRFMFLPNYLEIFFNLYDNNKKNKIVNNYLISTNGWHFKYITNQNEDILLNCIANAVEISVNDIKNSINSILLNNKNAESIFMSLNNGDIKSRFKTIKKYLIYINTTNEIEYELMYDILSIPTVIHEFGLNILIFEKKSGNLINNNNDFNIIYYNIENLHYLQDKNKINIILIKDNSLYFPVYYLVKNENISSTDIKKIFLSSDKIINIIYDYIKINSSNNIINIHKLISAKELFIKLQSYNLKDYLPTKQIIDSKDKCKYFVIKNKYLLPVKPSGILYWLPTETNSDIYLNSLYDVSNILYDIYNLSNKEIQVKPIGFYYSTKINNNYTINALIIDSNINIPIIEILLSYEDLLAYAKKYKIKNIHTEYKSIYDIIDKYIIEYDTKNIIIDDRINKINIAKHKIELYELFRLEISILLNKNINVKKLIDKILNDNDYSKVKKKYFIKKIFYYMINKKLYNIYIKKFTIKNDEDNENINTKINKLNIKNYISVDDNNVVDINNYIQNNNRNICNINNKNSCNNNFNCKWENNNCVFKINTSYFIEFVNKITDEILIKGIEYNELFNNKNYFVSDIVNKDNYTNRNNQKIIKTNINNYNINKMLKELYGNKIPIIGNRHLKKIQKFIDTSNITNSLEIIGNIMYQPINKTFELYRAYSNSIYWIFKKNLPNEYRNLGFYSNLQTELSNYYIGIVIEWIYYDNNQEQLLNDLYPIIKFNKKTFINELFTYLTIYKNILYCYIIELYILSKINNYIIIIYDIYNNIIGIFDNGIKYLKNYIECNNIDSYNKINSINIKFNLYTFSINSNPVSLTVMYFNQ